MIGESSILDLKVLLDIKLVEESKLHIILLGQMQLIRCGLESLMCAFFARWTTTAHWKIICKLLTK